MGKFFKLLIIIAVCIAAHYVYRLLNNAATPFSMPNSGWFGSGTRREDNTKVEPFKIHVSDEVLTDLTERLNRTRFFDALEDSKNFHYGFDVTYLREIHKYWQKTYDWRRHETILNEFDHFRTEIEGIKVHFIRVKPPAGKYTKVYPLLLVHGWPGSVWEFYKILPLLADPNGNKLKIPGTAKVDFAFEIIAPSIPGYGWSDEPKQTGFGAVAAARVFHKLMRRLQFDKYYCQGGDWGSLITTIIAQTYPQNILGLHLNMFFIQPTDHPMIALKMIVGAVMPSLIFDASELQSRISIGETFIRLIRESGYMHLQATKPDTVGFALNDSPMGLAAYILEKFSGWTNSLHIEMADGGLTRSFTLDELLTNVMIYWTNGNIAYSQRFYKETFIDPLFNAVQKGRITIPTALAAFPHDLIDPMPRTFAQHKYPNLTRYTPMPRGGHFAALQEPRLLAVDLFSFMLDLHSDGADGK